MAEFIKRTYGFTDYQVAKLRYFFLTMISELSKLLFLGFCFADVLGLFIWTNILFQLLRSSCGGLHCKTYFGCLFVSFGYMLLAIRILPLIFIPKVLQMIILLACIIISYHIGPLTSVYHPVLSEKISRHLKNKCFFIIFLYLLVLYVLPPSPYITVGFWVIILNTCQLILAKIQKIQKKEGLCK